MLSPASTAFQTRNHSIKIFKLSLRRFYQREAPPALITDLCSPIRRLGVSGHLDILTVITSSQVASSQVSSVCLGSRLDQGWAGPSIIFEEAEQRSIKITILN